MGLRQKSFGTFISKGAVFIIQFPIGILIARFLGPDGKGLLYLLFTAVALCALMGHLGLGTAAIYLIGREPTRLPAVVGNLLAVTAVVSGLVVSAGWLFLQVGRPDLYAQLPPWMWALAGGLIPIHMLRSLLRQVLSAVLRIKEINLLEVGAVAIHLLLCVLFVVIWHRGIAGTFWPK